MDSVEANLSLIKLKKLMETLNELEIVHLDTMRILESQYELKRSYVEEEIEFIKSELRAFALQREDELEETKTLKKFKKLPCGNLIFKKSQKKIIKYDDEKLLQWAEENAKEFVKETLVKKVDWSSIKKNLIINNDLIVEGDTGVVCEIPGIEIVESSEEFDIVF